MCLGIIDIPDKQTIDKKMDVTSAAGNFAVFPAGVGVGGVTPGSPAVSIGIPAEVRLQVC